MSSSPEEFPTFYLNNFEIIKKKTFIKFTNFAFTASPSTLRMRNTDINNN